jgi:germination protein M
LNTRRKKFQKYFAAVTVILFSIVLSACATKSSDKTASSDYYLYFVDKDETKVVQEAYKPKATDKDALIKEFIAALSKEPKNSSYQKAKPDSVILKDYTDNGSGQLILNFESSYLELKGIREVLSRAAIVKTFCQIEGVDYVEFQVGGQPLMDQYEKPFGMMTAEDFIDNTGGETKYKQNATITLFFANKKGNKLVESNIIVSYNGNIPLEQLAIEQLIAGPLKDDKYPTIPEGTKLIKAITKDGICYVDFNEKFLEKRKGITDEVAIYSVVNSLLEIPTINKVQFKINGELQATYRESTPFDVMFERNLNVIETPQ